MDTIPNKIRISNDCAFGGKKEKFVCGEDARTQHEKCLRFPICG
jgi:hypothetical protein